MFCGQQSQIALRGLITFCLSHGLLLDRPQEKARLTGSATLWHSSVRVFCRYAILQAGSSGTQGPGQTPTCSE